MFIASINFGCNVTLNPFRIIYSVKILFAEVRRNGDDYVSIPEFRGVLLDRCQDRSGTSSDK